MLQGIHMKERGLNKAELGEVTKVLLKILARTGGSNDEGEKDNNDKSEKDNNDKSEKDKNIKSEKDKNIKSEDNKSEEGNNDKSKEGNNDKSEDNHNKREEDNNNKSKLDNYGKSEKSNTDGAIQKKGSGWWWQWNPLRVVAWLWVRFRWLFALIFR